MANDKNLKPIQQTREQAKENGRKGGIASGRSKRAKKLLRDELIWLLAVKAAGEDGKKETFQKKISLALIQKAINGDVRAFEVIRDTIGEKPTDKQEIINDTPQIVVATQAEADLIKQIHNVKVN